MKIAQTKSKHQRYLTIGQLSKKLALKTYTLRYWESEVQYFQPLYVEGRRFYDEKQVKIAETLKDLIIVKGLTVKSASQAARSVAVEKAKTMPANSNLKNELMDILSSLSSIIGSPLEDRI